MTERKTALITGGTSGIGYEFARLLAKDNYQLILVARQANELQRITDQLTGEFGVNVQSIAIDLSESMAAQKVWQAVQRITDSIQVFVNNAGFGTSGRFDQITFEEDSALLQVNIVALTQLTKYALVGMVARHDGKIINIASTAAFQPGPYMATYYASKAYVLSFSEALTEELQGTGVTVTALCPGPTATKFQERAQLGRSRLFSRRLADPHIVAFLGYQGMQRGKRVVIPGFGNWLGARLVRLLPGWLVLPFIKNLNQANPS